MNTHGIVRSLRFFTMMPWQTPSSILDSTGPSALKGQLVEPITGSGIPARVGKAAIEISSLQEEKHGTTINHL